MKTLRVHLEEENVYTARVFGDTHVEAAENLAAFLRYLYEDWYQEFREKKPVEQHTKMPKFRRIEKDHGGTPHFVVEYTIGPTRTKYDEIVVPLQAHVEASNPE